MYYYGYILFFGALGGMARYGVSVIVPDGLFPWHTLIVNLVGSFLLGFAVSYLQSRKIFSQAFISGIGTGFIGTFTTFSTFSMETIQLLEAGHVALAMTYGIISAVAGLVLAFYGFSISVRLQRRRTLHVD